MLRPLAAVLGVRVGERDTGSGATVEQVHGYIVVIIHFDIGLVLLLGTTTVGTAAFLFGIATTVLAVTVASQSSSGATFATIASFGIVIAVVVRVRNVRLGSVDNFLESIVATLGLENARSKTRLVIVVCAKAGFSVSKSVGLLALSSLLTLADVVDQLAVVLVRELVDALKAKATEQTLKDVGTLTLKCCLCSVDQPN